MVRVNYPPGGETHLGSEAKREPKTVRVLKPPGGESSICFTDDDFTKRPVKNGASPPSTPTTSECSNGSLQKDDNVKSDSPVEEVCQFEAASNETNGMDNGSEEVRDSQPLPSPPIQSDSFPEPSFDRESSPQPNTNGCSSPDAESSNQINGDSEYTPKVTPDVADSGISDGENEPSLAPLSISSSESHSAEPPSTPTPSSPTPTPPSPSIRPDEDTKLRVLGHSVPCPPTSNVPSASISTSNREAAPRKVVDHMRSNIFLSDEDYAPTRTSRFAAPKPAEPTQNVQQTAPAAAPQRQRIPPGGFSTKLW